MLRFASLPLLSRRHFLAFVGLAPLPLHSNQLFRNRRVRVGSVRFRIEKRGNRNRRYIHIHGNETTARTVLHQHFSATEGEAIFVETGTRAIRVEGLLIDPNRMFSRIGAEASLERLNPDASQARIDRALRRLERDLPALLASVLPNEGGLVISVHNNSQGYNIQDEIPISNAHHLPMPVEPNNFFLVTNPHDYAILARGPYNAVLQQETATPDDGSLSRLCALRGIRYLNLEAKLGEASRQQEMLTWADTSLPIALEP